MLSHRSAFIFSVPVLVLAAFASCSNLALKQDLDPQLSDLQETRTSLESQWGEIDTLVSNVEADVKAFMDEPFDSAAVQSPEVVEAVVNRMEAEVDAEGNVIEASANAKASLDAVLANLNADSRARVQSFMTRGSALSSRLKSDLPSAISGCVKEAASAALKIAEVKVTADQKLDVADENPLMTDEDMAALRADHAKLMTELDSLQGLADQITQGATAYTSRVSAAVGQFNSKLESLKDSE